MEFRIWVETRLGGRILERKLATQVERPATGIGPEEIGLSLEEGKTLLRQVQARIMQIQAEALEPAHKKCVLCGRNQRIKDSRTRCVRTVFGSVRLFAAAICGAARLQSAHGLISESLSRTSTTGRSRNVNQFQQPRVQLARSADGRAEQRVFFVIGNVRRCDIGVHILLKLVMAAHFIDLAAEGGLCFERRSLKSIP